VPAATSDDAKWYPKACTPFQMTSPTLSVTMTPPAAARRKDVLRLLTRGMKRTTRAPTPVLRPETKDQKSGTHVEGVGIVSSSSRPISDAASSSEGAWPR
jgi:hypothetical protein